MATKKRRKRPSWDALAQDTRDLYLALLWKDGHSEQAIADFLSTTKGTIVGRRARLKLGNAGRETIKKAVDLERFFDLVDLHRMAQVEEESNGVVACLVPPEPEPDELEPDTDEPTSGEHTRTSQPPVANPQGYDEQRTALREKPKYQMTNDQNLMCKYEDTQRHRCPYMKEPGSDYCKLHGGSD